MTLVDVNVRFMRIFAGFTWRGASNDVDRGVLENADFQGFRTLRLRHLGQHCNVVLFCRLSPFHWPQNIWPWVTLNGLNGHFTLNFHYYDLRCQQLGYIFTVESVYTRDQRRCADVRQGIVICRIFGIRGKKLRIIRRRYIVGTLTNEANISI